jgi:hypothetical protein
MLTIVYVLISSTYSLFSMCFFPCCLTAHASAAVLCVSKWRPAMTLNCVWDGVKRWGGMMGVKLRGGGMVFCVYLKNLFNILKIE